MLKQYTQKTILKAKTSLLELEKDPKPTKVFIK